jgi:outer membrane lipoprotein SlyB
VSSPWQAGRGALIGGLAGAAVGGIVAAEHEEQLNRLKAHADLSEAQTAVLETKASEFRRALGACLEGRGYSVR